jgi:hypothetical protein
VGGHIDSEACVATGFRSPCNGVERLAGPGLVRACMRLLAQGGAGQLLRPRSLADDEGDAQRSTQGSVIGGRRRYLAGRLARRTVEDSKIR